eukprot:g443.t1
MAESSENVRRLFAELQTALDDNDYELAASLADEVIAEGDDNATGPAQNVKAFCLLKQNKPEEVLKLKSQGAIQPSFRAYALYRGRDFEGALTELENCDEEEEEGFVRNLRAQISFRKGEFGEAADSYTGLVNDGQEDAGVNLAVVDHLLGKEGALQASVAWAAQYNAACVELESGNGAAALANIVSALTNCMKEGGSAEDLALIRAQLGVAYQSQCRTKEAATAYEKTDTALLSAFNKFALANNQIALKADWSKVSESLKKLGSGGSGTVSKDGLLGQKLAYNRAVLAVLGKKENAEALTSELAEFGESGNKEKVLLDAASAFLKKDLQKCEAILKNPGAKNSAECVQALGELYSTHMKDEKKAVEYYSKLPPEERLAALDALNNFAWKQKKPEEVVKNLREAIDSAKSDKGKLQGVLRTAHRWAKNVLRDLPLQQEICQLYVEQVDPTDAYFLQQRVLALASTGQPEKAFELAEALVRGAASAGSASSAGSATSPMDVDGEELEQHVPLRLMAKAKSQKQRDLLDAGVAGKGGLKKRKRKPRYPKGFDPANPGPPPDPERWLPKQQRSGYKHPKGKKGKLGRGPQGVVSDEVRKAGPSTKNVEVVTEEVTRKAGKKKKRK